MLENDTTAGMVFEWLSSTPCPSCRVIPKATLYDEFGYPICPNCGTLIRSPTESVEPVAAHAETD